MTDREKALEAENAKLKDKIAELEAKQAKKNKKTGLQLRCNPVPTKTQ